MQAADQNSWEAVVYGGLVREHLHNGANERFSRIETALGAVREVIPNEGVRTITYIEPGK